MPNKTFNSPRQGRGSLLNYINAKTPKGQDQDVATAIMYLAPASESGYNVCAFSSEGCREACLYTAGYGAMPTVKQARIDRTLKFFDDRSGFMLKLEYEIEKFVRMARKQGFIPAIRLNGTSDLKWERLPIIASDGMYYRSMMDRFSDVQFYDYTKIPIRHRKNLPANYNLTFSLSESNDSDAAEALDNGVNVAVVFNNGLPETFMGYPVIDGDLNDVRFDNGSGKVIGLTAKGKARYDTSGFVRKTA